MMFLNCQFHIYVYTDSGVKEPTKHASFMRVRLLLRTWEVTSKKLLHQPNNSIWEGLFSKVPIIQGSYTIHP